MQKKNVAIMIHKMYGGGAEKVAANLSTYLSDEKYNKKVITYDSSKVGYAFSGEIIDLKLGVSKNPLGKLINFVKRVHKVKKIKKQNKVNVTISLLSGPNLVNILTRKNNKIVISVRSFLSASRPNFYGKIHRFFIKKFYNRADVIVAVSNEIKQDLIKTFKIDKDKIKVIYNFYDVDRIKQLSKEKITTDEYLFSFPTVITSGRLSEQKGQWHLIRAFKKVKEKVPEAKLVVLGDGDLKKYLSNLSKELGIDRDVHLLGFQSNPFKYLANANIYAFSSLYEGFPNALCEAMVCGLPVVSSDCSSGPREILEPSSSNESAIIDRIYYADFGVLVPTGDGKKYGAEKALTKSELLLAEAIINLFENKKVIKKYQVLSPQRINDFKKEAILKEWEMTMSPNHRGS